MAGVPRVESRRRSFFLLQRSGLPQVLVAVPTFLLLLGSAPTRASGATSVYQIGMSLNLGVTLASNDFTDGAPLAFTATFEYRNTLNLGWRAYGGGTRFDRTGSTLDEHTRAGFLGGAFMWYPTKFQDKRPQWVYVTAGGGLYNIDTWVGGYCFGVGFQLPAKDWPYLKIEGLYHGLASGEPDSFTTVTLGLKWGA